MDVRVLFCWLTEAFSTRFQLLPGQKLKSTKKKSKQNNFRTKATNFLKSIKMTSRREQRICDGRYNNKKKLRHLPRIKKVRTGSNTYTVQMVVKTGALPTTEVVVRSLFPNTVVSTLLHAVNQHVSTKQGLCVWLPGIPISFTFAVLHFHPILHKNAAGGLAHMVERSLSMREVPGSIPGFSRHYFLSTF